MDALSRGSLLASTVLHAGLLGALLWGLGPGAASPDETPASALETPESTTDSPAPAGQAHVVVPAFLAEAQRRRLEPTDLPPLPRRNLEELLPQLEAADAASGPGDEQRMHLPPAQAVQQRPDLVPDLPQPNPDLEALQKRYQEFGRQISHRLIWRWRSAWQRRYGMGVNGDHLLIDLTIRDSAISEARLAPGQSSGDPLFDRTLLEFLNAPARRGQPLNALAVPDRQITLPLYFR